MNFKQFYLGCLSHASYYLGSQGEAAIIDPQRDVQQYLDEAEQLADRIAILHEGKIIANGTLADLKKLFPPVEVEYVEKQPTLEDVFLAIVRKKEKK